jgi:HAD superfamily hydrolase (TIGR01509 family)
MRCFHLEDRREPLHYQCIRPFYGASRAKFASVLRAIIFDMDGTLVHSEQAAQDAIETTMRGLGKQLTSEQRDYIVGRAWQEIWAKMGGDAAMGLTLAGFIERYIGEYERLSRAHSTELPGARAVVRRLAARWPLALVSGSSRREIAMHLDILGLTPSFLWYIGADDYARGKPDPEPYLKALARLDVGAHEAVVIEDSQPGIRAARAAGIRVIAVRAGNFASQDQTAADLVVDTLDEVTDAVLEALVTR